MGSWLKDRGTHLLYLFLRCWMLPRHLNLPLTMIPSLVHRASHSSMLRRHQETTAGVTAHEDNVSKSSLKVLTCVMSAPQSARS